MQTNNQVLRAMVESEEVSLQATAEAREGFCCSKGRLHQEGLNKSQFRVNQGFVELGFNLI